METEFVKSVVKVGNSAGVILPKEWLNGRAQVKLIQKPLNIKRELIDILEPYLADIIGIYLVGSYARGEEEDESDIDILVITGNLTKKIVKEKYEIILISMENLEATLKNNIFPLLPMLKEAKPIINSSLIKKYAKTTLTNKNLKFYIGITKSAMKVNKIVIELAEMQNENISDNIVYSLILNLRQTYIVDCLIKNESPNKKDFLKLVKNITGSEKAYGAYVRSKNNEKRQEVISIIEAKKIYNYIIKEIKKHKKWIKRRV